MSWINEEKMNALLSIDFYATHESFSEHTLRNPSTSYVNARPTHIAVAIQFSRIKKQAATYMEDQLIRSFEFA